MDRRRLLTRIASLGTLGLAGGCTSTANSASTTQQMTASPSIEIRSQDTLPEDVAYSLAARVVSATATAESPPELEVSMTHHGSAEKTYRLGFKPPFSAVYSHGQDGPTLLLLGAGADTDPIDRNCWTPDVSADTVFPVLDVLEPRTFEPGDALTRRVGVWAAPGNDEPCLPTGEFRFQTRYPGPGEDRIVWGFDVELR